MWCVAMLGVTCRVWAKAASTARASQMSSSLAGSSSSTKAINTHYATTISQRLLLSFVSLVSSLYLLRYLLLGLAATCYLFL